VFAGAAAASSAAAVPSGGRQHREAPFHLQLPLMFTWHESAMQEWGNGNRQCNEDPQQTSEKLTFGPLGLHGSEDFRQSAGFRCHASGCALVLMVWSVGVGCARWH